LYPDVPKDDAFGKFYSKIEGNLYVVVQKKYNALGFFRIDE
jgi:hypothetical protein